MGTRLLLTFSLLIACGSLRLQAQTTQIVYLSGTDKDHTVNWDFFINTGELAGPIHQGGYYRFKYDITDLLKTGDNLLEVTVNKKSANASINLAERRANSALYGNDVFFPTEFMHGNYDGGAGLEDFWNAIINHPYGAGGFIWVFADGGIRRVDQDSTMDTANDSAPDGILGPHREKEGSFYTIKELWSPVVIKRKLITPKFDGRIAVENRYSYTNLNQCRFKWRLVSFPAAGDTGAGAITRAHRDLPKFNLAPGEKGFLQLDLPRNWSSCDALYLTAIDPHGRELFTWTWPITLPDQIKKPVNRASATEITTEDSANNLIVHSSGIALHSLYRRSVYVPPNGKAGSFKI